MATADELLAGHSSGDNKTLVIDNDLRTINIPSGVKVLGVASDDEVLRLNFKMPRYVSNTDLSTFSIRINYTNAKNVSDLYTVRDKVVGIDDITFTWLVGPIATQVKGSTKFNVCAVKLDSDGNIDKEFNTTIVTLDVLEGLEANPKAVTKYSDVIEQWRSELFGIGDTEEANIILVSEEQQAAVVAKGEEVLASIPEDYTTTYKMAEEALRTKADAITLDAEGTLITVNDSSSDPLQNLKLYGKSTQVKTTGAQLLPQPYYDSSTVRYGVTFTVNDDGSITMRGTNTAGDSVSCYFMLIPDFSATGTYTYKCYGLPDTCVTNIYYRGDVVGDTESTQDLYDENDYGFVIRVNAGATVNATVYPMLNAGDTILPYEPYTGGAPSPSPDYPQELESVENPMVNVCGKNLWDMSRMEPIGTMDMTIAGDTIHIAASDNVYGVKCPMPEMKVGIPYTLSVGSMTDYTESGWGFRLCYIDETYTTATKSSVSTVVPTKPVESVMLYIGFPYTGNKDIEISNIQVEVGSKVTEYEPYKEMQSLALARTLPGIPVTEGGNYTDSDGQQWICDEVDLDRGVYIRRIAEDVVDGMTSLVHKNGNASDKYLYYHGLSEASKKLPGCCTHFTHLDAYTENPSQYGTFNLTKATAAYFNAYGLVSGDNAMLADSTEFNNWFREQYEAGTPVTLYYAIETPIETPLTAEEIETYKTLKTNYPNTTILNNAGAWMKAKYNADTLIFLRDNQPKPTDEQVKVAVYEYADENGIQVPSDDHIKDLIAASLEEVANGTY